MKKVLKFLKKSVLQQNPVLLLFAGVTPLLASSVGIIEGAYMGCAALITLVVSCMLFWVLKKIIPEKIRDIVYLLSVACVVTILEILTQAFFPEIRENLGIYLPLLTVSGIVLPYAEKFSSSEQSFGSCTMGGLSYGIGYLAVCLVMSFVRELFGAGKLLGFEIFPERFAMSQLRSPVGGFILLGVLIAIFTKYFGKKEKEEESK